MAPAGVERGSSGSSPCSSSRSPHSGPGIHLSLQGVARALPGPLRRSSALAATWSGAVAICVAEQHSRAARQCPFLHARNGHAWDGRLVVAERLLILSKWLLLEGLTLAIFFSLIFVGKMCVFVSRPMNIATFLRKNGETQKRVVDFPRERYTHSETKSWKPSRILRVKPNFFIFFIVHHFSSFFSFFHFFSFFNFFFFVIFSVDGSVLLHSCSAPHSAAMLGRRRLSGHTDCLTFSPVVAGNGTASTPTATNPPTLQTCKASHRHSRRTVSTLFCLLIPCPLSPVPCTSRLAPTRSDHA